jgi:hypothetical protein
MTEHTGIMQKIMDEFASRTGLVGGRPPQRYLWTDAFAVCNYLTLFQKTGEKQYKKLALSLIDQVHKVLGKYRQDDSRSGWISGLEEEAGRRHPTAGGLRIGKKLGEHGSGDPYDDQLEWDRDGQYFHYLTKWMHALNRVAEVSGSMRYNRWAMELAKAAHAGFTYTVPGSSKKRMYWKMSIDLSRPLVSSMGQHDALDALVTYLYLAVTAKRDPEQSPTLNLDREIAEAMAMCAEMSWRTDDPLGVGGLLADGCLLTRITGRSDLPLEELLIDMLTDAAGGLESFIGSGALRHPAEYRLAFRELGLAIGLHGLEKMVAVIKDQPQYFPRQEALLSRLADLWKHSFLTEEIEEFWLTPLHQQSKTWTEHLDINSVMLATSLGPDGYLDQ